ncbi:hypothetical protein [Prosthecobacter sp.]|uniref:RNA polymerase sigma factor n=1 Tax=Prosthecobacter sp. TaxID=1965333 RepID=UPI001D90D2DB|nr:hypothetical protein [Prosthecobacter sp.]MCB1278494.1 sigma-70 family RNA polymerase sigma factor [Prosthecobacter sp.]
MPPTPTSDDPRSRDTLLGVAFPTTQWSLVLQAQKDGAEAARALNELCSRYWYPIYAYLRCRGFPRPDAQDITQSFFLRAVTEGLVKNADQTRGRLRSFLLGALSRHLTDHLRRENAEKRGGRAIVLPLQCHTSEERYERDLIDHRDPESLYLAAWARELIDRVRERLRAHYTRTKRAEIFELLHGCLSLDEQATPYRELSTQLNVSEAALRLQVFRLRRRFGKMLREEVALTVETPEELDEELSWLSRVLRGD